MNISDRLREERERLGLSQVEFGAIGGVKKLAQINYEKGERSPDSAYLAAIAAAGADVLYVLTGQPQGGAASTTPVLSASDRTLLEHFHAAPAQVQAGVQATLAVFAPAATAPKAGAARKRASAPGAARQQQTFQKEVGQVVQVSGNLAQTGFQFLGKGGKK